MKNLFYNILCGGLCLAAVFSCRKAEITIDVTDEPSQFCVIANTVETKTVNSGMNTNWENGDKIAVFHSSGDNVVSDGKFTITEPAGNKFYGTLGGELNPAAVYTWYGFYAENLDITSPDGLTVNLGGTFTQNGYNSTAHLAGTSLPLYGKVADVKGDATPSISMNQASGVLKLTVKSSSKEDIVINSVKFTADGQLVSGSFDIDITGESVVYTPVNAVSEATLNVTGGTAFTEAVLYIPVSPFTVPAGDAIHLSVNTDKGEFIADKTLEQEMTVTAGKMRKIGVDINTLSVVPGDEIAWKEEVISDVSDAGYRVFVSPAVTALSDYAITGIDADGFITGDEFTISYTETGIGGLSFGENCDYGKVVEPDKHEYTVRNITSDVEVSYMERYVAVGDYFYSDGTNGTDPIKEGCPTIGKVFRVGAREDDSPDTYGLDKINGYVVCTVPVEGEYKWLGVADAGSYKAVLDQLEGLSDTDRMDENRYLGYPLTQAIGKALAGYATVETDFPFWDVFRKFSTPAPEGTSGWYIPSVAQLKDIDAAAVYDGFTGTYYSSNVYAERGAEENVARIWAIEYQSNENATKQDWASDPRKFIVMLTF